MTKFWEAAPLGFFGLWLLMAPRTINRFLAELDRTMYGRDREMPEPIVIRVLGALLVLTAWVIWSGTPSE